MTSAEYVSNIIQQGEMLCPNCGDDHFYFDEFDSEANGGASQWVVCERCRASWTDRYVLVGYTGLERPNVND